MNFHRWTHLLSEMLVLGALVFPIAATVAALVGVAGWIWGGSKTGLLASGVTWCAIMGIVPIALRLSFGPDTRAICDRCLAWMAWRFRRPLEPQEQRRHPRYRVELPATFFSDRTSGFMKIGNLSAGGCRVRSQIPVTSGVFGQLLIDLPGTTAPLKVSHASVRWVKGHDCGIAFSRLGPEEQGVLNRLIGQLQAGRMEEAGHGSW